jgi:hypothetical protein
MFLSCHEKIDSLGAELDENAEPDTTTMLSERMDVAAAGNGLNNEHFIK